MEEWVRDIWEKWGKRHVEGMGKRHAKRMGMRLACRQSTAGTRHCRWAVRTQGRKCHTSRERGRASYGRRAPQPHASGRPMRRSARHSRRSLQSRAALSVAAVDRMSARPLRSSAARSRGGHSPAQESPTRRHRHRSSSTRRAPESACVECGWG